MQIVGGRWEVCLGDGSCVLSFLSFPSEFFNLSITVQSLGLGLGLLPGPGPGPAPPPQTLLALLAPHSARTDQVP